MSEKTQQFQNNAGTFFQDSTLVAVGPRIIVLTALGLNLKVVPTSEEYHYDNRSWTILSSTLKLARMSYGAISVPAVLFKNLPGGCQGVK